MSFVLPWRFAINPFLSATDRNFKKMLSLYADHFNKLVQKGATDADVLAMKNQYQPFHEGFITIYSNWRGSEGVGESRTLDVETQFGLLNSEIKVWEGRVRGIFPEDSVEERSIFPDKRMPFQKGTYEQRISALRTLFERLATYTTEPVLVTLSATVESFYNVISAARNAQQGNEISVSDYSASLEAQRVLCSKQMYGTLGKLMYKYLDNATLIEEYWDMSLLRDSGNNILGELSGGISGNNMPKNIPLTDITVSASTKFRITNLANGAQVLAFYFGDQPNAQPITGVIAVNTSDTLTKTAEELGYNPMRVYLTVLNPGDTDGNWEITVMEG